MTYAIAMTDKKLAHHFSKADTFTFYNDEGKAVAVFKNPALAVSGCSGKGLIIELLKARQCHTVIVRKVGQKTLGRLLNADLKVVVGNTRHSVEELLEHARLGENQLTDASQGVEKKKSSCCGHH